MEGWTDRQTDCCRAAKLLAPGRKAAVNQRKGWLSFFGTCLSGPEENCMKEGEDKKTLLFHPHCVQSAERDVEYQKESEVEEVLSHRPSIIVLHDPLQVDPTSLI